MTEYQLVGNIVEVDGAQYQRVSRWNDVHLADGWVNLEHWKNGKRPFITYSNRELGLDYMGRQVG